MTSLFKPDTPDIKPPPPVPTTDEARLKAEQDNKLRRRRGRAADIFSKQNSEPKTAATVLLGS